MKWIIKKIIGELVLVLVGKVKAICSECPTFLMQFCSSQGLSSEPNLTFGLDLWRSNQIFEQKMFGYLKWPGTRC